jgi:hypothetical protein
LQKSDIDILESKILKEYVAINQELVQWEADKAKHAAAMD